MRKAMPYPSVAGLLLAVVLLLTPRAVRGAVEDVPPADSLAVVGSLDMDEIVVTARAPEEIVPAQRLEGAELQRLGSHSVADAIRYFSGAQIKDYGGIGGLKTVNIRSMGSQHVGIFFDGIQVGNAQNGVVDLGRFSMDNVEAISLYNGQRSAIFQSARDYASASAVYLETRRPVFDSTRHDNLKLTLKGGSFKSINPSVLWEHRFGERLRASFNAEYMYTSGEYRFSTYSREGGYDTTEVRRNGDVSMFRAEAALFGDMRGGEWRAKAYFYDSERGYPGAVVRGIPGRFEHEDRQWDTNIFVQGSLRKQVAPFYRLMVNAKYAYDYMHYLNDPDDDDPTMYVNNRYRQQEAYLSAANLFTITPWWSANLSLDGQWNTLDADLVDFAYPERYTLLAAAATSLQFSRISIQGSLLYTHITDITRRRGQAAGAKNKLTPAVIVAYKPFRRHNLSFRAFYKDIFRMPTFNDLYYTEIGNKNLLPERSVQYDAGITYSREWQTGGYGFTLDTQIDAYFNQVHDKIVAVPGSSQFRWTMVNLGYVEIRGLDVALGGAMRHGRLAINANVSYTYQKAQDFTDPGQPTYGGQIPYIPWHSGSAIVGVVYGDWSLNYSFIYSGERYTQSDNIPSKYVPAWYTHDLSLSREIRLRRAVLSATLEVNNLLNQQYEVVARYPMPGTNFRLIISVRL